MTKKLKIKDLENDPNLPADKTESTTQVIGKLSIDDLSDDYEIPIAPKGTRTESGEKNRTTESAVDNLVYFERNFYISYFSKAISSLVALFCLDLTSHLMKVLDGVDVMNLSNFHSIFLGGSTNWLICKIAAFLLLVFFLASKKEIVANKKGIYGTNAVFFHNIFFVSKKVFIPWGKIAKVELKMRLFEPYLFFYGPKNEKLGDLEFSVRSREAFFQYIEKYAGRNHPLFNIKKSRFLI